MGIIFVVEINFIMRTFLALFVVTEALPTKSLPEEVFQWGEQYRKVTLDGPSLEDLTAIGDSVCREFYASREVDSSDVNNDYVANGGQGIVFRCWTTRTDVNPQETASKVYFDTSYMNMTQLELVNTAVNQTGVRPTLYMFHEYGYIEEWLGDYKDFNSGKVSMKLWEVEKEVANRLALVHSTEVEGIPKDSHVTGEAWWNTRTVKLHFGILENVLSTEEKWNRVLGWFGWDREEYENNVEWVHNLINDFHPRRERPHLCHNDPHGGNMMVKVNDTTGETLKLIDYDNTSYGYRAFDWSYYLIHSTNARVYEAAYFGKDPKEVQWPTTKYINEFFLEYLSNYDGWDADTITLSQIQAEFDIMTPYVLLEQQFMWGGQLGMSMFFKSNICEYERYQKLHGYPKPIDCEKLKYVFDDDFDYPSKTN